MADGVPRRADQSRWTLVETQIGLAAQDVDRMPADVRLSDAVSLLGAARESVADYVDGQTVPIDVVTVRRRVVVEPVTPENRIRRASGWALALIKSFESLKDGDTSTPRLDPYNDRPDDPEKGIWTIGWGHAIWYGGGYVRGRKGEALARMLYPTGISLPEAETLFESDVLETCRDMGPMLPAGVTENQYGALVCFAFNVGAGALGASTLLKKFKAGDIHGAADQFPKWNKSGGKVLAGLVRRRAAERAMFLKPDTAAAA